MITTTVESGHELTPPALTLSSHAGGGVGARPSDMAVKLPTPSWALKDLLFLVELMPGCQTALRPLQVGRMGICGPPFTCIGRRAPREPGLYS